MVEKNGLNQKWAFWNVGSILGILQHWGINGTFGQKKNLSFSHPHFNKISGDLTSPENVGKFDDVAELLGD